MTKRPKRSVAGLLGALVAGGSLLAFPLLLSSFQRSELRVSLTLKDVVDGPYVDLGGAATGEVHIDGKLSSANQAVSPGLHRISWTRDYMGGHTRTVGHTQLVGPFQERSAPSCSLSLLIAPSFLNQIAPILQTLVNEQLRGMKQWPIGKFKGATKANLQWVAWGDGFGADLLRARLALDFPDIAVGGHLRVAMHVEFENANVPLILTFVPLIDNGALTSRIFVDAKLDLDSRLVQWIADFFDGNDRVSKRIEAEVRREMRNVLDKPPDIPLAGGASLDIEFCEGKQLQFHKAGHVSMPLSLRVAETFPAPPKHPAPQSEPTATPSAAMTTPLAVELDRNALGAVLHALWSSGLLDSSLATNMVSAFNEHPTVRDFLSLRIESANVNLPPTLDFIAEDTLQLRSTSTVLFRDGDVKTKASLFAEFNIDSAFIREPSAPAHGGPAAVSLKALGLTCEDEDGTLRPCYAQIIAQVRANQDELQEQLAEMLRDLLLELFTQRTINAPGAPASYRLQSTEFHLDGTRLRANLWGGVEADR